MNGDIDTDVAKLNMEELKKQIYWLEKNKQKIKKLKKKSPTKKTKKMS